MQHFQNKTCPECGDPNCYLSNPRDLDGYLVRIWICGNCDYSWEEED